MKRDFLTSVVGNGSIFKKRILQHVLKWLAAFCAANSIMIIFMLLLTLIQIKWRLKDTTLRLILTVLITISSAVCAYLHTRFSKIKGYICGAITAAVYGTIKLIMSSVSGGLAGKNIMIYVCIICAAMIGGILSANHKHRKKDDVSKIYKIGKMK